MNKIIGFLSPLGKFIRCSTYEHMSKAKKICEKNKIEVNNGVEAEEYLLAHGYIIFREKNVYKGERNENKELIMLTKQQLKFIQKHMKNFNIFQKSDIQIIVKDFS